MAAERGREVGGGVSKEDDEGILCATQKVLGTGCGPALANGPRPSLPFPSIERGPDKRGHRLLLASLRGDPFSMPRITIVGIHAAITLPKLYHTNRSHQHMCPLPSALDATAGVGSVIRKTCDLRLMCFLILVGGGSRLKTGIVMGVWSSFRYQYLTLQDRKSVV